MPNQQVKDAFTPEGKAELARILQHLQEAEKAFQKFNAVENAASLDFHNEGSSLNHCIRWGLQAAQDLNQAVGNPEPTELTVSEVPIQLGVLALNDHGVVHETFADERARSLWCSEQDASVDTFLFVDVKGQVTDYGIASTGRQALEDVEEDELDVYVVVTGTATDPEDDTVPGVYLIQVSLQRAVVIENLSDEDQSAIAKGVLDSFHNHQGIEELDAFDIAVHLSNGEVIDDDVVLGNQRSIVTDANHCGKVSADEVPFDFEGKGDLQSKDAAEDVQIADPSVQAEAVDARVDALSRLRQQAGAAYTLYLVATKALQDVSGDATSVDWDQVHQDVWAKAVGQDLQPVATVLEAIKRHSPGAVTPEQLAAVEALGESRGEDPDYWYTHRHELESGQVFRMNDDSLVKLDRRVAGDGTKWRVADWSNGWAYCDNEIEPGDLRGQPLEDPQGQVKPVIMRESGPSGP